MSHLTIQFWKLTRLKLSQKQFFFINLPNILSLFKSLILYIQRLILNTESITNISLDQFSVQALVKIFLCLLIFTLSPTLNLGSSLFALISLDKAV